VTHDTGAPLHLVGANVSATQPLAPGAPIELAFDRLLLPSGSITRQTFQLTDLQGTAQEPVLAYDPVSRVVRLCFSTPSSDQSYRLTIAPPSDHNDPYGLRAIDGALLDPTQGGVCAASSLPSCVLEFPVKSGPSTYTGVDACSGAAVIDFCTDVAPIFAGTCSAKAGCHVGGKTQDQLPLGPAAGLFLDTSAHIRATAINRVAQGSNTGSRAASHASTRPFGVDMPIIDAASAPGDSWLVYKLLLAAPACTVEPVDPNSCSGTLAPPPTQRLAVPWSPLADSERATLADLIPGREMPYPKDPNAVSGTYADPTTLSADDMETISLWILQGAPLPDCATPSP
jgi:hypothetical protein